MGGGRDWAATNGRVLAVHCLGFIVYGMCSLVAGLMLAGGGAVIVCNGIF